MNHRRPNSVRSRPRLPPRLLILAVLIIGVLAGLTWVRQPPATKGDPDVVARVNDDEITVAELHRAKVDLLAMRGLMEEPTRELGAVDLETEVVESLIDRQLLLQEARRRDLSVTDNEVDAAISELRGRFPSLESFGAWMQERGLSDQFLMDAIRADILAGRVTGLLTEKVRVTETEVAEYYATHKDELYVGEQVRLAIIAVESLAASEEVLTALQEGTAFNRLVRERSIAPGGDTGWVDPRGLPLPLQKAIEGLDDGEATGPVKKAEREYLVVGMAGRRPVRAANPIEATPEIERRLLPMAKQRGISLWLAQARKKARIERYLGTE